MAKLENVTILQGEEARFNIKFSGKPLPACKWYKDDIEIDATQTDRFEIVPNNDNVTLILKSSQSSDSGLFYAHLSNEAGILTSNKAQLTVKCK